MSPAGDGLPSLRSGQIVIGALIVGLATFTGIVALLGPSASPAGGAGIWTLLVAGFTLANLTAVTIVSKLFVARTRQRYAAGNLATDRLLGEFVTLTILRGALVEAPGLFACIAYTVGEAPIALPVALGCVVALLAIVFPTEGRFQSYFAAITRPE